MSPRVIAQTARDAGLDLIALTDHNTAANTPAFADACREAGIAALYGCEATSSEEAHVLGLFSDPEAAIDFGAAMYASLPRDVRDPDAYGDQVIVNVDEEILGVLDSFLIGATSYGVDAIGQMIHERGGLFIPAHIDRSQFSIWSQLGFLPQDSYDAVEMVQPGRTDRIDPRGWTAIANSDAHFPDAIGQRGFAFSADAPTVEGLRGALASGAVKVYGV